MRTANTPAGPWLTAAVLGALWLAVAAAGVRAQNPFLQSEKGRVVAGISYYGNHVTKEYILQRAFGVKVGDPYDATAVSDGWERLEELPFISFVEVQEKRPSPTEVFLVIQVEEDPRFTWAPVIDYEARHEGFLLGLGAQFQNVRGRAETVSARATWTKRHGYDLRWENPQILGAAAIGVYVQGTWERYDFLYEPLRLRDAHGTAGLWHDFGRWATLAASYTYRELESDENQGTAPGGVTTDPWIGLRLSHDSRDRRYYPSRGVYASVAGQFAGLGPQHTYQTYDGQLAAFVPVPFVEILAGRVAYRGAAGLADGENLPFYARSYLGGAHNLRGVDFGSVRGDQSYLATVEIRRPLFLFPLREGRSVGFGLHAFADWGKAYDHGSHFDDAPLRSSFGLGAHINFNTKNFRFEWAHADDDDDVFVFEDEFTF